MFLAANFPSIQPRMQPSTYLLTVSPADARSAYSAISVTQRSILRFYLSVFVILRAVGLIKFVGWATVRLIA